MRELGRFSVIYADPPWSFKTFSAKGTGRSAVSHYDTLSLEQLQSLRKTLDTIAASDCALLLWVVRWLPSRAIADLLDSWGFVEKGTALHLGQDHEGRQPLPDRQRLLYSCQPGALPACDPRQTKTADADVRGADHCATSGALTQTRDRLRVHRTTLWWALHRIVQSQYPPGLDQLGQ